MDSIKALAQQASSEIQAADSTKQLKEIEIRYLGKSGLITTKMKELGSVPAHEKPLFGKAINEAKVQISVSIENRTLILKSSEREAQFASEKIDVTMPGIGASKSNLHILEQITRKIKTVFSGLGFQYHESPEIEAFKYNFELLNYPPNHPAMDELDTFYVTDDLLLRSQCTPLQGHVFESTKPPLRAFTVGRVYRNDAVDRTHSHTFHQVDAFMVDEGVSMAHLKGTLTMFSKAMFGDDVQTRFRPSFFPFVEPGVEYDISSPKFANGQWLELGGAGMIHPNILENFGIDSEKYTGWAFGLGIERIPLLAYGVQDLRYFLENDLRFLEQFPS
jgi:phenylalanyl-tRNA synthetase alpha chain